MKIEHLAALICALSAVSVAQTSTPSPTQNSIPTSAITGSGKRGYLPKFAGPSQINDSAIVQSPEGNVGIGTTTPLFPLHIFSANTTPPPGQYRTALYLETPVSVDGTNTVAIQGLASSNSGSVFGVLGTTYSPGGIAVLGNNTGDLLVIDPAAKRHLALAHKPYSTLVAGVYSTKPGMLGSTRNIDASRANDEIPLAVVGIVPCNVSAENGPIRAGDLLVTSSTPGHAMRGTDRGRMLGAVVGKALEPLSAGMGVIQVLVTLQ
jgi:hypothetical protein